MKKLTKGIVSVALAGSMMMSIAGCASFNLITHKEFKSALEDALKLDDEDYTEYKNSTVNGNDTKHEVYAVDDKCRYAFIEFDEVEDAVDYFEDIYDEFEDTVNDKDFDGTYKKMYSESGATGYILVDGDSDNDDFMDGKCYGGIFLKENTIVIVMANSNKSSDMEDIDAMLSAIGYPKP